MVYKFGRDALQFLLPASCMLCNTTTPDGLCLCRSCRDDLPVTAAACLICALPLSAPGICGHCLGRPPAFDDVLALFLYQSPVNHLVQQLKYGHRFDVASLFAVQLSGHCASLPESPDLLVPVPLHRSRLRQRGYNQAWELTRRLSRHSGIPTDHRLCKRTRPTPSQTGLTAVQRRRNLHRAFSVTRDIEGLHIAVVDDVMTTGSTLQAMAEALKGKGATRVTGLVVARANRNKKD
jgi:ComF family protein